MHRLGMLMLVIGLFTLVSFGMIPPASADGTETLGAPSGPVANGTGVAVAGAGMFEQPASFTVTVPANAVVNQVLLYWEAGHRHGDASGEEPDSSIRINGIDVEADGRIGGETFFYGSAAGDVFTATHRVDITNLGLVTAGSTTVTVDGLDLDEVDDGAGVLVIYSEPGAEPFEIMLVDGNDIAFVNFEAPRDSTVPQSFTFAPAEIVRIAELSMIVSSIHDPVPGCSCRPNFMEYTIAGETTRLPDPFPDTEGREFDTASFDITIPAGASELSVQMLSQFIEGDPNLPASLVWLAAALAVQPAPTQPTTTMQPTTTTQPVAVLPTTAVLAFTGTSSPGPTLALGLAALGLGVTLVVFGRRRLT